MLGLRKRRETKTEKGKGEKKRKKIPDLSGSAQRDLVGRKKMILVNGVSSMRRSVDCWKDLARIPRTDGCYVRVGDWERGEARC